MKILIVKMSVLIALLSLCAPGAGCLFEPREAMDPSGGGEDTWIDPQVPEDVFKNLMTGLSESGNSNYERSLSENFKFVARPTDESTYGVLADWDKTDEMNFLDFLKGDYPVSREIRFGDEEGNFIDDSQGGTNPWFEGEYLYTLNDGTGETYFGGIARFTFEEDAQGKWVLFEWKDIDVLETYSTAGIMRGISGVGASRE
jgi:hypothetical protein